MTLNDAGADARLPLETMREVLCSLALAVCSLICRTLLHT